MVPACVEMVRGMILRGELAPGQRVLQTQLANTLKVSRIPLRETLATLHAEGVLDYTPNVGYSVVRLSHDELAQIYAMRELLETLLFQSISSLPPETIARMEELSDEMKRANNESDVSGFIQANRKFHFELFNVSAYKLVIAQVERLWNQAELYQLVANYDAKHRKRVITEHRRLIRLAKRGAIHDLIVAATEHRLAIGDLDRTLITPRLPSRVS